MSPASPLGAPRLEVNDVGAHLVQERTEVRGADDGPVEGFQPILVGDFKPSEKYESQLGVGMIILYIWKNKNHVPVSTNQNLPTT